MRNTQQFSITLPREMADQIDRKIESGDYATVSEVVREGIRALLERDAAVERWLRKEVVKSYDKLKADPTSGIPADKVLPRLRAKRAGARRRAGGE
jgi:putative addiction module CopG family antidote